MGKKRKTPGINGSSSADIAFMLLIFFLITTSMDTDQGLARRLPPPVPKDQKNDADVDIKKRNLLVVLVSSGNQIMCGGELTDIKQLKDKVKEFVENPYNDANKPEKVEVDVPYFGKKMVSKNHVISLQSDRGTSYQANIDVQNELAAAYNELRKPSWIWMKNSKKLFSKFIRRRFLKLNLKTTEESNDGKI